MMAIVAFGPSKSMVVTFSPCSAMKRMPKSRHHANEGGKTLPASPARR
jgi:hypothetical protein